VGEVNLQQLWRCVAPLAARLSGRLQPGPACPAAGGPWLGVEALGRRRRRRRRRRRHAPHSQTLQANLASLSAVQ